MASSFRISSLVPGGLVVASITEFEDMVNVEAGAGAASADKSTGVLEPWFKKRRSTPKSF